MFKELLKLTITDAHKELAAKEISARELTEAHITHSKKKDAEIGAYVNHTFDEALAQADAVDEKIRFGNNLSPLAGVPVAIKDNILIKGHTATAASKILKDYIAPYDATVIRKLKAYDA